MTLRYYLMRCLLYFSVLIIIIIAVFPFYYAIITSLKSGTSLFYVEYLPKSISLINYKQIANNSNFMVSIFNSVLIATLTVLVSLTLSLTAAYAIARIRFRGKKLLLLTILAVSMFPQIALLAGLFELIKYLNLYNTSWALILSYTIFTLPFTIWILTTFAREIPIEIEDAAIMDGANTYIIITKVFIPLLKPSIVTVSLLSFIAAWNEFLFALTFTVSDTQRTVPVAIALLSGTSPHEIPWGVIMAASIVVTVPLIVLVLIFQSKIVSGLTAGGVKG